ncbi:MAG: leucyl aminopeptidase [Vampirovibrionales bacterium]|nr:leucyl aminopeptidase [Vampirovibrionales bacterium]
MSSHLKIDIVNDPLLDVEAGAVVIGVAEDWEQRDNAVLSAADEAMHGGLKSELKAVTQSGAFKGKVGDTHIVNTLGHLKARYVILLGLGKFEDKKPENASPENIRRAAASAIRAAQKLKVQSVSMACLYCYDSAFDGLVAPQSMGGLIAEGAVLANYQFKLRKTKSEDKKEKDKKEEAQTYELEKLIVATPGNDRFPAIERGVLIGRTIAKNVNRARDWVNDSANYVTPTFLKEQAEGIKGLECRVLDAKEIKKQGMGLFDLVAKGSDEPPFLIHLSYKSQQNPKEGPKKKVALVGKGLTFDSGGLSLKPAKSMELMKMDMAGAAAVIATMRAIAKLEAKGVSLDVEVHGFVGTCENMPSARSSKPGDIAVSKNGKTVEVNNTDAEGRLVLADVLTYAQEQVNPDQIIDLATLTGACIVALGKVASGVMGTDKTLISDIIESGKKAGEKFWELPLYDEYKKSLESDVADLINAGSGGEAGSQNGGMFLKEFIDEGRSWAHLDIAGPAWTSRDLPEVPKGGTGVAVRTLLYYLYKDFS